MSGKSDVILDALKDRYFRVLGKENYPHTPKVTEEADNLEAAIRDLQAKQQKEKAE